MLTRRTPCVSSPTGALPLNLPPINRKSLNVKMKSLASSSTSAPCSTVGRRWTTSTAAKSAAPRPTSFRTCTCSRRAARASRQTFVDALRRALVHYGIKTLERSPELEECLLWLCKSHQRVEQQIAPIVGLLERHLQRVEASAPRTDEAFRKLLGRLIHVTRGQFPAVSDLAREVRYRCFEQPVFERARRQIYAQAEEHLAHLAANPNPMDLRQRVGALVECPQPLAGLFSGRYAAAPPALRELMLEIVTTRYYRGQTLTKFRTVPMDGHSCVTAEYDENGKHVHIFSTNTEYLRLSDAARALFPCIQAVPARPRGRHRFSSVESRVLVRSGTDPEGSLLHAQPG